mgnify:CR=1 FL=1
MILKTYYLASSQRIGVSRGTPGWSETVPQLSDRARYLWQYTEEAEDDQPGTPKFYSQPSIIETYNDVDWHGNRYDETYEYIKVSPVDWSEHGAYDYITNGSIEMSDSTDLKVTGSFSFNGPVAPDPNYMLRVYYSFEDETGHTTKIPISTMFVGFSGLKYRDSTKGMTYSGSLTANSVLTFLQKKKYGEPFVVKRNENCIYKAAQLIQEFGMRVEYTPDITLMSADHTFSAGTDYLEIVNWLCAVAGYRDAYPDAEGVIQLQPYIEPEAQTVKIEFADDEYSILYPEVDEENDWQEHANVVKLLYNTDKYCMMATAKNLRGSRISLEAVNGRETTLFEDIGELGKSGSMLMNLVNLAEEKLRDEAKETEYITISHAYVPIELSQAVQIEYGGYEWLGGAENVSIELAPSTKTQTKIKKTTEAQIELTKSGRTYRGGDEQIDG